MREAPGTGIARENVILSVEVTDRCNFRCRMCDHGVKDGAPHGRPPEFMTRELFSHICRSLDDFPVGMVTPFWVGESAMHPEFPDMMRELLAGNDENRRFRHLSLNSNGAVFDADCTDTFLATPPAPMADDTIVRLHFSIDAIRKDTYARIKGPSILDRTNRNVEYFLRRLAESGKRYPNFNIVIIVMDENALEVRDFVGYWSERIRTHRLPFDVTWDWPRGDRNAIYVRRLDDPARQREAETLHKKIVFDLGLIPRVEPEKRIIVTNQVFKDPGRDHNVGRRPCAGPWKTPIIHSSGDVTVCCFDVNLALVMGNVGTQSLETIWNGDPIHRLRMKHLLGGLEDVPTCHGCVNLNTPLLTDTEIVGYLGARGEAVPDRYRRGAGREAAEIEMARRGAAAASTEQAALEAAAAVSRDAGVAPQQVHSIG